MSKTPQDYCLKCRRNTRLTKHHIFPKRWYGKGGLNPEVATLCLYCHRNFEAILWNFETKTGTRDRTKLRKQVYLDIFLDYIKKRK